MSARYRRVPESLQCAVCKTILNKPVQASCGCRFHHECFKSLFRECDKPLCPVCNEELDSKVCYRDVFADKELSQLDVLCSYHTKGCKWCGPHGSLQEHLTSCLFAPVPCLNRGCSALVDRSALEEHLSSVCDFRIVRCQYCTESVTSRAMDDHLASCLKFPIICPNECGNGEGILRENMEAHLQVCPNRVINCNVVGCTFKGEQRAMQRHSETCLPLHISLLSDEVKAIQLQTTSVEGRRQELDSLLSATRKEETNSATVAKIAAIESQVQELESRHAIMQQKTIEACYQSVDNVQKQFKTTLESFDQHVRLLTDKCLKFENVISTQTAMLQQLESEVTQYRTQNGMSPAVQKQLAAQDRVAATHDVTLAEHSLRLDMMDCKNTDGVLLWKITEVRRRRRDAVSGKTPSIYSQPFYTSQNGYKMCARLYLNGDGMGRGSHLSLFFVIMRGEYDNLLPWPFKQKVSFILIDQDGRNHVSDAFRPDTSSSSFQKPKNEMNVASGCPLFVPLATLDSGGYIKEDAMFIKMMVDTTGITRPEAR